MRTPKQLPLGLYAAELESRRTAGRYPAATWIRQQRWSESHLLVMADGWREIGVGEEVVLHLLAQLTPLWPRSTEPGRDFAAQVAHVHAYFENLYPGG
jgi:hypothetical protein